MKNRWVKRQPEILAAAKAEGRGLTAAEQAEFDECQRQIDVEDGEDPAGGGDPSGSGEPSGGDAPAGGERGGVTLLAPGMNVSNLDTTAPNSADVQRQIEAERKRSADIMALCRQTGMECQ